MSRQKSVYFGTPDFAVPILEALAEQTELVAVVTQPDKPKGRGGELAAPPVKLWAQAHGIPVFQPVKLRDGVLAAALRPLAPDVAVVAAYGRILPAELLTLPRLGCLNVHGSILPKWRGAAPIQWAIAAGDAETGVTLMQMDEGLDTGDVLLIRRLPIGPEDTGGTLHDALAQLGATLLREGMPDYFAGALLRVKQDDAAHTLAPILDKTHGRMDFSLPARLVECRVRGFSPWPGAFTFLAPGTRESLKVHRAKVVEGRAGAAPGTVLGMTPPTVACADGSAIELLEVQPEGKRRMLAREWAAGRRGEAPPRIDPDRHAG